MKSLGLYTAPIKTDVILELQPNKDVLSYVVFLNRYVGASRTTDKTYLPHEVEAAGARFTTAAAVGYELAIKAQIRSGGDAKMNGELTIGSQSFPQSFDLPAAEGPVVSREWSIIIV